MAEKARFLLYPSCKEDTIIHFFTSVASEIITTHTWDASQEELKLLYILFKDLPGEKDLKC